MSRQNKVLKTWHFTDAKGKNVSMIIRVADVFGSIKKGEGQVKLYYTAKELPKGKLLAEVALSQQTVVKL